MTSAIFYGGEEKGKGKHSTFTNKWLVIKRGDNNEYVTFIDLPTDEKFFPYTCRLRIYISLMW